MSLIDSIRKLGEKKSITKEKFKQLQEDDKLQTMLEERKKSANQRELERHFKEKREEKIKTELDKVHKKQNQDNWKGDNLLKGHKSILTDDRPILKEKNIFKNKGNMFLGNKSNIPFMGRSNVFK